MTQSLASLRADDARDEFAEKLTSDWLYCDSCDMRVPADAHYNALHRVFVLTCPHCGAWLDEIDAPDADNPAAKRY